jgi:hypothetical protein
LNLYFLPEGNGRKEKKENKVKMQVTICQDRRRKVAKLYQVKMEVNKRQGEGSSEKEGRTEEGSLVAAVVGLVRTMAAKTKDQCVKEDKNV